MLACFTARAYLVAGSFYRVLVLPCTHSTVRSFYCSLVLPCARFTVRSFYHALVLLHSYFAGCLFAERLFYRALVLPRAQSILQIDPKTSNTIHIQGFNQSGRYNLVHEYNQVFKCIQQYELNKRQPSFNVRKSRNLWKSHRLLC